MPTLAEIRAERARREAARARERLARDAERRDFIAGEAGLAGKANFEFAVLPYGPFSVRGQFAAARLQHHPRVVDGAGHAHRLRGGGLLAGKAFQLADNAASAVDQLADHLQVFRHVVVAAARQQRLGVVGKGV